MNDSDDASPANRVLVRGRISGPPESRELPSGTPIVSFRVVVPRSRTAMTKGSRQTSDWVVCTAWSGQTRRRVRGWRRGDVVEIEGALRRRHYRTGELSGSRVEIEMLAGRLVHRSE